MSRPSVAVRHASAADLPSLDPLWDELVATLGDGPARTAASRLRDRVATGAADQQLVVALAGGVPVGLLTFAVVDQGPWGEAPSLVIGLLHVQARSRRRGVAKALLGWVAAHADEVGCGDVSVQVPPSMREQNRFFARYGFAPVVTRRGTTPSALRRRVTADRGVGRLVDLRVRQRSLRRRGASPAVATSTLAAGGVAAKVE